MAVTGFNYIRARKLKYTYGILVLTSKEQAKSKGISDDYINNPNNISYDGYVKDIFAIVARKNERISIGDIKTITSFRRSMTSTIPILKSDKLDPKLRSDGAELAELIVPHKCAKR
eukprot:1135573_1